MKKSLGKGGGGEGGLGGEGSTTPGGKSKQPGGKNKQPGGKNKQRGGKNKQPGGKNEQQPHIDIVGERSTRRSAGEAKTGGKDRIHPSRQDCAGQ